MIYGFSIARSTLPNSRRARAIRHAENGPHDLCLHDLCLAFSALLWYVYGVVYITSQTFRLIRFQLSCFKHNCNKESRFTYGLLSDINRGFPPASR